MKVRVEFTDYEPEESWHMLETLLRNIDRIYDLELEVDIEEFLIGPETCKRLSGEPGSDAVLVLQGGPQEDIRVGIFIREETLSFLNDFELSSSLTRQELYLLSTAVEEVSHFAYLLWNASRGKPVTRLELEIQGEVDKFVTTVLLSAKQNRGRVSSNLLEELFSGFELRDDLDESRRARYQAASSLARSYCCSLVRRFLSKARLADLLAELRVFYRLTQGGKVGHISRAVYAS